MATIIITGTILFAVLATVTLYAYKPLAKYIITVILMVLICFPGLGVGAAYAIGLNASQRGAIGGFKQFLNGTLVDARVTPYACLRDGECVHTEDCDPYTVVVSTAYTDSDGKYHPEVDEVDYHQCPIATMEYTYYIVYTTHPDGSHPKNMVIADHIFAANPIRWSEPGGVDWRWFSSPSLGDVPRGAPRAWLTFRQEKAAGNAPSITVQDQYDNYILSSEGTILRRYSDDIDKLRNAGLILDHTANLANPIHDFVEADKMQFACMHKPPNAAAWQSALMHFNSALGMKLQGDMHVVAVKASCLVKLGVDPEDLLNATQAYELNYLGKNAIAKNGIILILGVDDSGSVIQWAKADTGMPIGNGIMLQRLQTELTNLSFSPATVFGDTKASIVNIKGTLVPRYTLGNGVVPKVTMVEEPFARACMACTSAADKAKGQGDQGFTYLSTEIPLAGSTLVETDLAWAFVMFLVWAGVFLIVIPTKASEDPFRELSWQTRPEAYLSTRNHYRY